MDKKDKNDPQVEMMAAWHKAMPFLRLMYRDEDIQKIMALAQSPDTLLKTPQTWLSKLNALTEKRSGDIADAGVSTLLSIASQLQECLRALRQNGQIARRETIDFSIVGQELSRFFAYIDDKLDDDVFDHFISPVRTLQMPDMIETDSDQLMQEGAAFETRVAALFRQHRRFAERAYKPMLSAILELTRAALGIQSKHVRDLLGDIMKECEKLWKAHPGPWPRSVLDPLVRELRNADAHCDYKLDIEHEWVILNKRPSEPLTHDRFSEAVANFAQLCATMWCFFSADGIR